MIARLAKKARQYKPWVRSVSPWRDIPAALLMSFQIAPPIARVGALGRLLRRLSRAGYIQPRALNGLKLFVDPSNFDEVAIYDEVFVQEVYRLSAVPFVPDLVLDCGGFVGHFSLLAKARFPSTRICSFEPHPDNFESMRSNLEINRLTAEIHCAAVSSFEGSSFFSGGGCGGRISTTQSAHSRSVKVVDLLSLLARLSPERLLLKIDIEGEERELLPALIPNLPRTSAMFFEWHHEVIAFEEIELTLRRHGFSVERLRLRPATGACVYLDAFALRV